MSPSHRHRVDIEVRYAETDAMGIVHHSNYLVWFELARTGLCRVTGTPYDRIEAAGYRLVVTATETRHHRGARYGDVVAVDCWIERMGSRGIRFAYLVWRGDERLASGATEHVWTEATSGRPCRAPRAVQESFLALLHDQEAEVSQRRV